MDQNFDGKTIFDQKGYKPVAVGKRLRELRTGSGFSIRSLAEKSGLSVNTLSLIENDKTSPSVNTLEQLAIALEVPLTAFFESETAQHRIIVTQPGSRRKMRFKGMLVEDCGLELKGQTIQPLIVTLPPNMENPSDPNLHTGDEFVYCLSGIVDYYIEDEKFSLYKGDSLVMDASLRHRWFNPYQEPAVYLLVMVPGDAGKLNGKVHFQVDNENGN